MPVVQRLDSQLVPHQRELALLFIVNNKCPEPGQLRQHLRTPPGPGMQNYLGIGRTFAANSTGGEFASQFLEVIDLAVEGNYMPFIFQGLGAAIVQTDDTEPGVGQVQVRVNPEPDRIRAAPPKRAQVSMVKDGKTASCQNAAHLSSILTEVPYPPKSTK